MGVLLASAASLSSIVALSLASGCSSSPGTTDSAAMETASSQGEALSTRSDRFVTVRRDVRKCIAPLCGGYFVHELNSCEGERYVSSLDLSGTGLDDASVASALEASDSLVLRGRLGATEPRFRTRPLVVRDVWRGMPGVASTPDADFYTVAPRNPPIECLVAPCPEQIATLLNTRDTFAFDGVDVSPAVLPWVDGAWLASRVVDHHAVVAASWVRGQHYPGGYAWTLKTSQVYVHLPDRIGPCPAAPVKKCDDGTIAAFERNADRCVIQAACVTPAICPKYRPACPAGYTFASWVGRTGCDQFACDPTFVTN